MATKKVKEAAPKGKKTKDIKVKVSVDTKYPGNNTRAFRS